MSKHVLIVGGGLAGPCLALSLAKHNIRSTIFEIKPGRSESGGSISLGPSAVRALDKFAGVYDQIKSTGFSFYRYGAYAEDGRKFGEIAVGEEGDGKGGEKGYPSIRLLRTALNGILLDAAQKSGLIDIKYGVKLSTIQESKEGVVAHFEDGAEVKGDILIGADGIYSRVRHHVLGDKTPTPHYDGLAVVNGFLPITSAITPSPEFTFPAFMFTASGVFMTVPIDHDGQTLAWGITREVKEKTRRGWKEFEASGEAARLAKSDFAGINAQPVRSLLDNAIDAKARLWPTYSTPELPKWHTERVCLIGDAAHALPPNGYGTAMAFEDAAVLTRLLTEKSDMDIGKLFERFEKLRKPRITRLVEQAKLSGSVKTRTAPWFWMVKKWGIGAYFRWKGGVLQYGQELAYDANEVDLDK